MNELKEIQKAQLAVAIDAEGNIGIYKTQSRDSAYRSGWHISFNPTVRLTNKSWEWLKYFHDITGCGSLDKPRPLGPNKKAYLLTWKCRQAQVILKQVYEYLIIKKKVAEMIFEWYDFKDKNKIKKMSGKQAEKFIYEHASLYARKFKD